jgi:hypothetical protein
MTSLELFFLHLKKRINSGDDFILCSHVIPENNRYLRLFKQGLKQLQLNNDIEVFRNELLK